MQAPEPYLDLSTKPANFRQDTPKKTVFNKLKKSLRTMLGT